MASQNGSGATQNGTGYYQGGQDQSYYLDGRRTPILDHNGKPFDRYGMNSPGGPETAYALPHVMQFSTILSQGWKIYQSRRYDNAYRQSQQEAIDMANNDCFLMGIVNERRFATTSLGWRIEVDDEHDGVEKCLKDSLTKVVRNFPYWDSFVYSMMLTIWYGRMGSQVAWEWKEFNLPDPVEAMPTVSIPGMPPSSPSKTPKHRRKVAVVTKHQPVNGDSIVHHFDGTPGVLLHMPAEIPNTDATWTDKGRAILLRGSWRDRFMIHTHESWAADYFDADMAEAIHGIGVRHFIYWMNWMRMEWLTNVADWCERTGLGVRLWYYQGGNKRSEDAVKLAAKTQSDRTNILIPRYGDGNRAVEGVEYVDTASTGAELLLKLWKHLEDIIERFIIGQSVSAGREGGGIGGTGEAAFANDTKGRIVRFDANNFSSMFTQEYIRRVIGWSWPQYRDVPIRFRFNVDQPNPETYFQAVSSFIGLGGTVREDEARSVLGAQEPQEGDKVLKRQEPPSIGGAPGEGNPGEASLQQLLAPLSPEDQENSSELDLDGPPEGEFEGDEDQPNTDASAMGDDPPVSQKVKAGEVSQYINESHAQGTFKTATGSEGKAGEFAPKGDLGTPEQGAQATAAGQKPLGQQQASMMGKPSQTAVPGSNGGKGQAGAGKAGEQMLPQVGLSHIHVGLQNLAQQGFAASHSPEERQQVVDAAVDAHSSHLKHMYSRLKGKIGSVPDNFKNTLRQAHSTFKKAMDAMDLGLQVDLASEMQLHNAKMDAEGRHLLAGGGTSDVDLSESMQRKNVGPGGQIMTADGKSDATPEAVESATKEAETGKTSGEALLKSLNKAKKENPDASASEIRKFLPKGVEAHSWDHAISMAKDSVGDAKTKMDDLQKAGDFHASSQKPKEEVPEKLYHGSSSEKISEFSEAEIGKNKDSGFFGRGVYLTPHEQLAGKYGKHIHEVGHSLKNTYSWPEGAGNARTEALGTKQLPEEIRGDVMKEYDKIVAAKPPEKESSGWTSINASSPEMEKGNDLSHAIRKVLSSRGHDSAAAVNPVSGVKEYVAFDPKGLKPSIKSGGQPAKEPGQAADHPGGSPADQIKQLRAANKGGGATISHELPASLGHVLRRFGDLDEEEFLRDISDNPQEAEKEKSAFYELRKASADYASKNKEGDSKHSLSLSQDAWKLLHDDVEKYSEEDEFEGNPKFMASRRSAQKFMGEIKSKMHGRQKPRQYQMETPDNGVQDSDSILVANHYAELLNLIHDEGGDVPQHLLEIAHLALHDGQHHVDFDGHRFVVKDIGEGDDNDEPKQYAKVHAPLGGITVQGRTFRGGTFIPTEFIKKLSPEEKQEMYAKIALAQGVDPQAIRAAIQKRNLGQQQEGEKNKNLKKQYEAMRRNHGDALEKNLGLEAHELNQHAKSKHANDKLKNMADMMDMAKGQGGAASGGSPAIGGGKVVGQESVEPPAGIVVNHGHGGFVASLKGFQSKGATEEEAVGNLMKEHGAKFGLPVESKDAASQYQRYPGHSLSPRSPEEIMATPEHNLLAKALEALVARHSPQEQHTHIHIPETMKMEIPVPQVTVLVPEQAAPQVFVEGTVVNVPPQTINVASPVVNVEAQDAPIVNVDVKVPEQRLVKKTVTKKDGDGNPIEVIEEPI